MLLGCQVEKGQIGGTCNTNVTWEFLNIFWSETWRERPLGTPRRRWEDNIRMDLRGIGWEGVGWIDLAEDKVQWQPLVNTAMTLNVP